MWIRIKHWSIRVAMLSMVATSAVATPEPGVSVDVAVHRLQQEWEEVLYTLPDEQHASRFQDLLARIGQLEGQNPALASPKALKAMVLCTYAGTRVGLGALDMVQTARELLQAAISIDPGVLNGSAYITLGNLYQRLPGWPVSFGDDALARQYFEAALKLFPDALDTHYFYGNFLLGQGDYEQARVHLLKADSIALTDEASVADRQLKRQIKDALQAAETRHPLKDDFFSRLLPDWGLSAK